MLFEKSASTKSINQIFEFRPDCLLGSKLLPEGERAHAGNNFNIRIALLYR
jgi:hypothetical protein